VYHYLNDLGKQMENYLKNIRQGFTDKYSHSGQGNASVSPDANGNDTIAHGLSDTPDYVQVGIRGDNANGVDVESVDATNITVRVKDAAGADVTAGTFTVDWEAEL
jgi:hypothetical protein